MKKITSEVTTNKKRSVKGLLRVRKRGLAKALGALALGCLASPFATAGWSVNEGQILDPNGRPFVYRGINLGFLPPAASLPQVYADIAATGANAVRVPVDGLTIAQAEVHVKLCKEHKLVCVFTHVRSAGHPDRGGDGSLDSMFMWAQLAPLLKANENHIVIDLASAWAGNTEAPHFYLSQVRTALYYLRRESQLKNQIIVTGGNWGQDWSFLMRDNAEAFLAADLLENTVLALHMYEAYRDPQVIRDTLSYFKTHNLPVMITEFGPIKRDRPRELKNPYTTTDVAVESIMDISQELGIGYMGWTWSGYKAKDPNLHLPPDFTALNMVTSFDPQQVTPWGNLLINGEDGLKATAKTATHLLSDNPGPVANRAPKAFIDTRFSVGECGVQAGLLKAIAADADDDVLTYSWEIRKSDTATPIFATGASVDVVWPSGVELHATVVIDDGKGGVVTKIRDFGPNRVANECSSAQSSSRSAATTSSNTTTSKTSSSSSSVTIAPPRSSSSSRTSSSLPRTSSVPSIASSSSRAAVAKCRYVVNSQWGSGFTASIHVKNTGSQPIDGWNVSWQYSDGSTITNSWNAKLSGSNPYTANNVNWNATIRPGQTVQFGFQGKKPAGSASVPRITGNICQ